MVQMHLYYHVKGEHVHVRVFVGKQLGELAHCGNLILRVEEFLALSRGQYSVGFFEDNPES